MKYFKNINSLEDLKKQFKKLAFKHHPDKGGDIEVMKAINNEFEILFHIWKNRDNIKTEETAESTRNEFYTQNGWKTEKFLGFLNDDKIVSEIQELYHELHLNLWTDGYIKHDIILTIDGDVEYTSYIGNQTRMDVYEGNAILICTMDEYPEVSDEELGELEDVDNYNDYIEWLEEDAEDYGYETTEEIEEHIEEYADDWEKYSEFDSETYEEQQLLAWQFNCEQYDWDYIDDKIYQRIANLEEIGEEYFHRGF